MVLAVVAPDIPIPTITPSTSYIKGGAFGRISNVTLRCEVDFPAWHNVSFEVQWIVDGVETKKQTLTTERFSRLEEKRHAGNQGFEAGSMVSIPKENVHPWIVMGCSFIFPLIVITPTQFKPVSYSCLFFLPRAWNAKHETSYWYGGDISITRSISLDNLTSLPPGITASIDC